MIKQGLVAVLAVNLFVANGPASGNEELVARGQYLINIAGCNDCHTPGYIMSDGQVPVSEWLKGDALGWRGPWGTTYPTNLRLRINEMDEAAWIAYARNLRSRPPMPWFNVNAMSEDDLKAIYAFVAHLGPAGEPAPAYLPPDQEPAPPYATFPAAPPQ